MYLKAIYNTIILYSSFLQGSTWRSPKYFLLYVLFGLGCTGILILTQPIIVVDDAYFSYRYVYNLLHADQLVFNLNERVEGATDLLWILLLALAGELVHVRTELLAVILELLLFAYSVTRTAELASRLTGDRVHALLAAATIFVNANVFLAATNGLEGALYMALLIEAFWALSRRRSIALGIILGLLFMTRPEGCVVGLIFAFGHAMHVRSWRAGGLGVGILLGIVAVVSSIRLVYYNALVPNSIVAKSFPINTLPLVAVQSSWPYIRSFARDNPVLAVTSFLIVLACSFDNGKLSKPKDPKPPILLCSALIILFSFAVAIRNGGDWMAHSRLLTQYAPAYATGLAALVGFRRSGALILAMTTIVSLLYLPVGSCCKVTVRLTPPSEFFSEAASRLAGIIRPDDVVSAEAAGLLPYRLISTRIHDPIGLLDPYIARHGTPAIPYGKTDINYTFGTVRPSFMAWHWAGHVRAARADLRAAYKGFCYSLCDQGDLAMVVLVRTDRMDKAVDYAFADWTPWPLP